MSAPTKLFDAFRLGPFALSSRVVMAPLTRNRAQPPGMVPGLLAAEYYRQRASAGLIITEASQISRQGQGYQDTPGIYSKEQIAGWRKITDRVHEQGNGVQDTCPSGHDRTVCAPLDFPSRLAPTFFDAFSPAALHLASSSGVVPDSRAGVRGLRTWPSVEREWHGRAGAWGR